MSTHTPGPWIAYNSKNGKIFKQWRVDTGTGTIIVDDAAHWQAGNANLIAAAPVMLEALKAILTDYLGRYHDTGGTDTDLLDRITYIRNVIKQANGE